MQYENNVPVPQAGFYIGRGGGGGGGEGGLSLQTAEDSLGEGALSDNPPSKWT